MSTASAIMTAIVILAILNISGSVSTVAIPPSSKNRGYAVQNSRANQIDGESNTCKSHEAMLLSAHQFFAGGGGLRKPRMMGFCAARRWPLAFGRCLHGPTLHSRPLGRSPASVVYVTASVVGTEDRYMILFAVRVLLWSKSGNLTCSTPLRYRKDGRLFPLEIHLALQSYPAVDLTFLPGSAQPTLGRQHFQRLPAAVANLAARLIPQGAALDAG